MPSTWKQYGVDANHDGKKDPFNPVDAIFAAARYLKAAGADTDIRSAIFAYNHADWYVDSVLMRARLIGGLPADLVGSLTGLTQGHFPVNAKATYADDLSERDAQQEDRQGPQRRACRSRPTRAAAGSTSTPRPARPAIATQDGRVVKIGKTKRLGRFIQLQDVYGNTYTYAHLKRSPRAYAVPKAAEGLQAPGPERARAAQEGHGADAGRQRRRTQPKARRADQGARRGRREQRRRSPARRQGASIVGSTPGRRAEGARVRQPVAPDVLQARRRGAAPQPRVPDRQHDATRRSSPRSWAWTARTSRSSAQGRLQGRRRHRSSAASARRRSTSRRTCSSRSAPPARARRGSTPSRSSTAGSSSSPRRSTARRARTRSSAPTPRTRRSARSC